MGQSLLAISRINEEQLHHHSQILIVAVQLSSCFNCMCMVMVIISIISDVKCTLACYTLLPACTWCAGKMTELTKRICMCLTSIWMCTCPILLVFVAVLLNVQKKLLSFCA